MIPARDTFGLVSWWSEVGLYVMFAPFAIAFIIGIWRRLKGIELHKLITGAPGGIAGALGRFGSHALMQRRVGRRPRGWPHLGIFFGFLVLLAATTIVAIDWDITRPFGIRILSGMPYLVFEAFVDAFGLIFVIGLCAALVWRLIRLKRTGQDQRRIQFQFILLIAALLYLGVTGFVLEAFRLIIKPVPWGDWSVVGIRLVPLFEWGGITPEIAQPIYSGLWWSHAFVAFAVIASLPYTTFLHSVGAPLNVMVHSGRPQKALSTPFDLREVLESGVFDVKVGVSSLDDLDAESRFALEACTNCGRCDEVCPAMAMETALSPRRLVQTLRSQLLGGFNSKDLLSENVVTSEEVWACTTCAACVEACPVFIRPVDYIVPFRRELVARQLLDKSQGDLISNLSLSSNAYGLPGERRDALAVELRSQSTTARERADG